MQCLLSELAFAHLTLSAVLKSFTLSNMTTAHFCFSGVFNKYMGFSLTLVTCVAFRKKRKNDGKRSDARQMRSGSTWRTRGKTENPRRQH